MPDTLLPGLTLITVPAGFHGGRWHVSICLSIRLGKGTLAEHDPWTRWPEWLNQRIAAIEGGRSGGFLVKTLEQSVEVTDVRLHPPQHTPGPKGLYWEEGWRRLFPPSIDVAPPIPTHAEQRSDHLTKNYSSYDPVHLVHLVTQAYTNLGVANLSNRPSSQDVRKQFSAFRFYLQENDSDLAKYEAQIMHDSIVTAVKRERRSLVAVAGQQASLTSRVALESKDPNREGLQRSLERLWFRGSAKELTAQSLEKALNQPFLTAGAYRALADYFDVPIAKAVPEKPNSESASFTPDQGLVEAMLYHTPGLLNSRADGSEQYRVNEDKRCRSFTERLMLLNHHPSLRKALGLTLDVSFVADFTSMPNGSIQVLWHGVVAEAPWTAFEWFDGPTRSQATKRFFLPRSLPVDQSKESDDALDRFPRGLLNVCRGLPKSSLSSAASSGCRYALGLIEPSGTFFKAQSEAQPVGTRTEACAKNEEAQGLPVLRASGISFFHRAASASARARQERDNVLYKKSLGLQILFAEDLLLGFRPDFRLDLGDKRTSPWFSTVSRRVRIEFLRTTKNSTPAADMSWTLPNPDPCIESFVPLIGLEQADPEKGASKVPPELFRWDNWTLGSNLPLKGRRRSDAAASTEWEMPLRELTSAQPGSLLRLIHGRSYWARIRATFLDGSGILTDDLPEQHDTHLGSPTDPHKQPILFNRIRQIGGPVILLERYAEIDKRPLESLTTIVKRTGGSKVPGVEAVSRVLVPPPMSPFEVYRHGHVLVRHGRLIECLAFANRTSWPARAVGTADRQQTFPFWHGALVAKRPERMEEVYLPDSDAMTLEITCQTRPYGSLPSQKETLRLEHFDGVSWPFFRPVVVELHRSPSNQQQTFQLRAKPNAADGVLLEVYVLPGAQVSLEAHYLICENHQAHLRDQPVTDMFLFGKLLHERLSLQEGVSLPVEVRREHLARHWSLCQSVVLNLVHATPEPVFAPRFDHFSLATSSASLIGESSIPLTLQASIHYASTGKVEIWAKWEDPIDDQKENPKPRCDKHEVPIKSFNLSDPEKPGTQFTPELGELKHHLGDYKHHRITYGIRGISRFRAYFPAQNKTTLAFDWSKADRRELVIPNRAKLDAVAPQYLIPLLRREFEASDDDNIVRQYRRARHLRVYLARPWYSSGVGELVGILCPRRGTPNQDLYGSPLGEVVSVWGQAPFWNTAGVLHPLSTSDLPGILEVRDLDLSLTADPDKDTPAIKLPVTVGGFAPWFDEKRQLWCCDIPLPRSAGYRPLVRLALVRYQPESCEGLHISAPVSTAFSSVMPDRLVTVRRLDHGRREFEVTIFGIAPDSSYAQKAKVQLPHGTVMELRIEERYPNTESDYCWSAVNSDSGHFTAQPVHEISSNSITHSGVYSPIDLVDRAADASALRVWRTTIKFRRKFGCHYRLTVREREHWLGEGPKQRESEPIAWERLEPDTEVRGRYVFFDEVPL